MHTSVQPIYPQSPTYAMQRTNNNKSKLEKKRKTPITAPRAENLHKRNTIIPKGISPFVLFQPSLSNISPIPLYATWHRAKSHLYRFPNLSLPP